MRHGFLPVEAESVDSVILTMLCAFQLVVPLDLAYIVLLFFISGLFLLYVRCDFYLLIVVLVDVRVDECMYVCAHECVVCCVYVHIQAQDPYHVSFLSYSPPYFETWFHTEPRTHVLTRPPDQHCRNPPPP